MGDPKWPWTGEALSAWGPPSRIWAFAGGEGWCSSALRSASTTGWLGAKGAGRAVEETGRTRLSEVRMPAVSRDTSVTGGRGRPRERPAEHVRPRKRCRVPGSGSCKSHHESTYNQSKCNCIGQENTGQKYVELVIFYTLNEGRLYGTVLEECMTILRTVHQAGADRVQHRGAPRSSASHERIALFSPLNRSCFISQRPSPERASADAFGRQLPRRTAQFACLRRATRRRRPVLDMYEPEQAAVSRHVRTLARALRSAA